MKPIRGEHKRSVIHDPWDRTEQPVAHQDVAHVVTPNGALESATVDRQFALGCGCLGKPAAGFCALCETPVCADCYGFCANDGCGRPLCRRHSVFFQAPDGTMRRLCGRCYDGHTRRRLGRAVIRTFLGPFVRFEDDHEQ